MNTNLHDADVAVDRPHRTTISTVPTYKEAERIVDWLSDEQFPVERVAIVGTELRYVEQVARRMTTGRAALAGLGRGAMFGLWFGLLFGLFFTLDSGRYAACSSTASPAERCLAPSSLPSRTRCRGAVATSRLWRRRSPTATKSRLTGWLPRRPRSSPACPESCDCASGVLTIPTGGGSSTAGRCWRSPRRGPTACGYCSTRAAYT